MRFGTFAATTVLAIAAVGISAGTVAAEPAAVDRQNASSGVDRGVGYRTVLADLDRTVTTSVDGGRFEMTADGARVLVRSEGGEVIAEVPLTFDISGQRLELVEQIDDHGEKLTLTPRMTAEEIGELRAIGSMDRLIAEIDRNIVGVVVGGILGGIIGAAVGLLMLSVITGPIGLIVGAIAGGMIMGGQPFTDALTAVATGQP
ncbi:hypothetical protein [Nocardia sp. NPDC050406]|uniref:hypothetical protein n=1 Tax=Nocardia sp. NPDC050406 TaxID=3364318 RepID=UPI003788CDEB